MVHRTRLGLTVHDGDLAHVELVDDLVHQFQWARCASHDAGSQRRQIIGCDIGEVGFGNKHGRHTVQRRALFFRNRAQHNIRVEAFIRKDRARGMGQACQIPHDHAKAVIQGHWNTQSVMLAKAHTCAHLQAVVQNIEMTQGRALWVARGAASKLNIDRIIRLQGCGDLRHAVAFGGAARGAHLVEIEHARCFFAAHTNDAF